MTARHQTSTLKSRLTRLPRANPSEDEEVPTGDRDRSPPALVTASRPDDPDDPEEPGPGAHLPHWREIVTNLVEPEIDIEEDGWQENASEDIGPALNPISKGTASEDVTRVYAGRPKQAPMPEPQGGPSPIVPRATMAGRALTLVVAIMSFLACLTVGALTVLYDATVSWQSDIAREVTIQVRPTTDTDLALALQQAAEIARAWPGVVDARPLSDAETRALLEPWLGGALDISELPVPRLITVVLDTDVPFDTALAQTMLSAAVPGASLDDHQHWTDRLSTMAMAAILIGLLVLSLVLTATVLSVIFATRAAMAANRGVIEVLHLVGAENSFIAGEFQRHFLVLGLKGGIVGGLLAVAALVGAVLITGQTQGSAITDQIDALTGGLVIGPEAVMGAIFIVALISAITALTSRLTVHRFIALTD